MKAVICDTCQKTITGDAMNPVWLMTVHVAGHERLQGLPTRVEHSIGIDICPDCVKRLELTRGKDHIRCALLEHLQCKQ